MTNIGLWQCVDIGMWQSGCYWPMPVCGQVNATAKIQGAVSGKVKLQGSVETGAKIEGKAKTYQCED